MRLKNMSPSFSVLDTTHLWTANTVVVGDEVMRPWIGTDSDHLSLREFGIADVLPANTGWRLPALFVSVGHVLYLCAQKQMARIYALWNIAAVKHAQSAWDQSMGQFPCDSVSQSHSIGKPKLTVAGSDCGRHPQPAGIGLGDLRPEAFGYAFPSHVTSLGSVVRSAVGGQIPVALRYFTTVMS